MKCKNCSLNETKLGSNLCEYCETEFEKLYLKRLDALKILLEALEECEQDKKDKNIH